MSRKIIIVDDNEDMLKMLESLFNMAGGVKDLTDVDLVCFSDPIDCLEYFEENMHDVSIVISDFYMPRMRGDQLYNTLKILDPGLRLIFLSGTLCFDNSIDVEGLRCESNILGIYGKPLEHGIKFARDIVSLVLEDLC